MNVDQHISWLLTWLSADWLQKLPSFSMYSVSTNVISSLMYLFILFLVLKVLWCLALLFILIKQKHIYYFSKSVVAHILLLHRSSLLLPPRYNLCLWHVAQTHGPGIVFPSIMNNGTSPDRKLLSWGHMPLCSLWLHGPVHYHVYKGSAQVLWWQGFRLGDALV